MINKEATMEAKKAELLEGMNSYEAAVLTALMIKKEVSLDEIIQHMGIDPTAKGARHSAIVRMKYLNDKSSQKGWIISRTSGIGRGAKGRYSMKKKF